MRSKIKKEINDKNNSNVIILLLLSLFFSACGGGNSQSTGSDTTVTCATTVEVNSFKIFNPHCWVVGTSFTFNLSGTDPSGGNDFTSKFSFTKQNDSAYEGIPATQFDAFFSLSNSAGPITSYTTNVFASSETGVTLAEVRGIGGSVCIVTNASLNIPSIIRDGESGIGYNYSCSDGTNVTTTWKANIDQLSGNIMYANTFEARDQVTNNLYVTETDTYYLDTDGFPQRIDSLVVIGGSTLYEMSSN